MVAGGADRWLVKLGGVDGGVDALVKNNNSEMLLVESSFFLLKIILAFLMQFKRCHL
ncbi:hypothetical protein [Bartonella harrusi]|uniref:Uncharacterized protein n=1 Tax=Bartonella harrusi TaxID=2961895 RepID=A0ABY5ESS8_9HYPH|nr:hypothetical protein [Bartonella harrusi]UTO28194.1 hypothetical protein NMK50_08485 [Bartonella harrusi]